MEENDKIEEVFRLIENDKDLRLDVLKYIMNSADSKLAALVASDFFNEKCITISGIADIAKKTSQATLSMIKCNESDFPKPFNVGGTNLYNKADVIEWLLNNNKIARDEDDIVRPEFLYGTTKTVVFVGGPGNGKSTLASSAANKDIVKPLRKIFSAGGAADTENLIKFHYKNNSVNYVVFHYGEAANDSIPIKITENNVKRIKDELKKCKDVAKELRDSDDLASKKLLIGTYVELVLQPNMTITNLMSECNIDVLTFVDTPGIDNKHVGISVSTADAVVVVLGDRDDVGDIAEKIKNNIVPQTGTSTYVYLYNNRFSLNADSLTDEECDEMYNEYWDEAKEDLKDYAEDLKRLQADLVIGTTLSACKPFESLICVPNFSREPDKTDEFFYKKFCAKLKEAFNNSIYFTELNSFDMNLLGNKFLELMKKHVCEFNKTLSETKKYGISDFINENHGRTKSLDYYRIECSYNEAISALKNHFYNSFKQYNTKDFDDDEASVIRLVYLTLNQGLMNKIHYGSGSHPWEDLNSPTQMICEEVLSEQIMNAHGRSYCDILKENGVRSNSWNYVYVNATDWNKAKLFVSNKYGFPKTEVANLIEYIKICHFMPAILVQSILSYYKLNPSNWAQSDFDIKYDKVIKVIYK